MRHRRTSRVVLSAILAPTLAVGLGTGAAATVAAPDSGSTLTTTTTMSTTSTVADPISVIQPTADGLTSTAATTVDTTVGPVLTASADSGVGGVDVPPVSVEGTLPQDHLPSEPPSTAVLFDILNDYLGPTVAPAICPEGADYSATCSQAFVVVGAASECLRPFVASSDEAGCGPLVEATTQLLLLIAGEGLACANAENAACKTAQDGVVGATGALLRCVGVDPSPVVDADRESIVTGRNSLVDLYALCSEVVSAATAAAAEAVTAAQACASGSNALCADVQTTVLQVANATLRCLEADVQLPEGGGASLLAADVAGACAQALDTARTTLEALVALAQDCAGNPEGTCQTVIGVAYDTADAIRVEAEDSASQAARCLTGDGDATGELVAACQDLQDRIAGAIGNTTLAIEREEVAGVGIAEGDVYADTATTVVARVGVVRDPTTLDLVVEARRQVRAVDDAGNTLAQTNEDLETLTYTGADTAVQPGPGGGSCYLSGDELKKKAIKAYPPIRTPKSYNEIGMDFQYTTHLYQSDFARPLIGVGWTWQVEGCQYGGADVYGGWRLKGTGSGMTIEEVQESRIDQSWASGKEVGNLDASLYAHVGSESAPVQVGGQIRQTSSGENIGSSGSRGPVTREDFDPYKHNAVIGRWRAVCTMTAPKWCGSRDFQGSLVHGLWEWPRTEVNSKKWMLFAYYNERRCTAFGGCAGP